MQNKTKILYFATQNPHKLREAQEILGSYGFRVDQLNTDPVLPEIQSDTLVPIATYTAQTALKTHQKPVFVEDAGLFIEALKGFPGPYSSYVLKTIGLSGILSLMEKLDERSAEFRAVIAFIQPDKEEVKIFKGITKGNISHTIRGDQWGYDPIFIPQGFTQTYAEMGPQHKNEVSHRFRALKKFAQWLQTQF